MLDLLVQEIFFQIIINNLNSILDKDILPMIEKMYESRTTGRWTQEEHEKFLYGLKIYGKNWKQIQTVLQTRSSTQIRSHAQKFFIKMKKALDYDQESQVIEQSQELKFQHQNITCPSQTKSEESQYDNLSFFMQRILQNIVIYQSSGQQFDFWNSLIDEQKKLKTRSCSLISILKDCEQINLDQKPLYKRIVQVIQQESESNFKRTQGQYQFHQKVQSQPCKKLKFK